MSDIGKKIKDLRVESGITQLQLAEYCGCTGQIISNIERGYTKPDPEILNKIATIFKVPSDYILGVTNSKWMAENPYSSDNHMHERIKALMQEQDISIECFAKRVEIQTEDVDSILSGSLKPNTDVLSRIASLLSTTIDYLIGSSSMKIALKNDEEQDIILYYRNMSKRGKRIFMGVLEEMREK